MALKAKHKDIQFGVGDRIRVIQKIKEKGKERLQVFEGIVIRIKGRDIGKTFTVRRIGVQQIGIEKIFPLESPLIESVEVVKKGLRGVRRAKLYYIREKPRKEIDKIYSRAKIREEAKKGAGKVETKSVKKAVKKKPASTKKVSARKTATKKSSAGKKAKKK